MKKIILVGGGGHCKSVIDIIEQQHEFEIAGIVDKKEYMGRDLLGYKYIADDRMLHKLVKEYVYFAVTIGHMMTNTRRVTLYKKIKKMGVQFPVIISPHSYVSQHASLGEGTVVFHGAVVNAGADIGINTIINSHCLVEHDVTVLNHSHISTGALLNGSCKIGNNCFIGSQSVVIQGKAVGDDIVIGANALVNKHLTDPGIYIGTPAHKVQAK